MNIQIKLLSPDAKIPTRGSEFAAGYDLYTIEPLELKPGQRHLYKTGISTAMPSGIYGRIAPRSGLAYKNGIETMAGVIDSDYRGEIGVLLVNLSTVNWTPTKDKPIAQIIFENHNVVSFQQTNELPDSVRSTGGFGHTDVKIPVVVPDNAKDLVNQWKKTEDHPTPRKYETVIREREKLIQPK
jgi:dUTP pyrophosphatase